MKWKAILLIALSLAVVQISYAKDKKKKKKITISGYVVDDNDKPIQGVSIIVDGKSLNKVTNKKGFYKIKVKPEIKTLEVYSLFHGGLEIDFKGIRKINFILTSSTIDSQEKVDESIAEIDVVNAGYKYRKKEDVTSSTSKGIDTEKGSTLTKYNNIFDMIRSQFPGIIVRGNSVIIRGLGSMNANNAALFVVDGVIMSSIGYINPSVVESISILKGASASVYGMSGANGVILITTKGGK